MSERIVAERIIQQLHAARVGGDLAGMCRVFADAGRYEILGASADKPIAIRAQSLRGISALALHDGQGVPAQQLSALEPDGRNAARGRALARRYFFQGHGRRRCPPNWSMWSRSNAERIATYTEFFAPR